MFSNVLKVVIRRLSRKNDLYSLNIRTCEESKMKTATEVNKRTKLEAFGAEMQALREKTLQQVGETDRTYIRRVIAWQKIIKWTGRILILAGAVSFHPVALVIGVLALSASQIIENMEVGHNVLHGQYDFMNDEKINSQVYEWGPVVTSDHWKHFHNYIHHTYTNVIGRDHDVGYGFIRISPEQRWQPAHLWQAPLATWLAVNFQHLTALHDARPMEYLYPEKWRPESIEERPGWGVFFRKVDQYLRKAGPIMFREYVFFPLLAGPYFLTVLFANLIARGLTNVWEFAIIFCGHFTRDTHFFTEEEFQNEDKAGWYLRQVLGSSNLSGSALFYFMTGHLSHQVEHHLFPDIPAHRYPEMGLEVEKICEKYGIPYNTDSFWSQFSTVLYRIFRLSLPGTGKAEQSKVQFDRSKLLQPAEDAGLQENRNIVTGPHRLHLEKSEKSIACSGEDTLLEEIEKTGMKPKAGCRRGICHTCKVSKKQGRIQNTDTGEISDDGEEIIRICISQPVSDVKLNL